MKTEDFVKIVRGFYKKTRPENDPDVFFLCAKYGKLIKQRVQAGADGPQWHLRPAGKIAGQGRTESGR